MLPLRLLDKLFGQGHMFGNNMRTGPNAANGRGLAIVKAVKLGLGKGVGVVQTGVTRNRRRVEEVTFRCRHLILDHITHGLKRYHINWGRV